MKEYDDCKKTNDEQFHDNFEQLLWIKIKNQCNETNRIYLSEIELSKQAQITIGQSINEISSHFLIEGKNLYDVMSKNIYCIDGDLFFIFEIFDMEMMVNIPKEFWKYKKNENTNIH